MALRGFGPLGILSILVLGATNLITGLVFGTIFAISGEIWTLMVAHAAFDLVAVAIIYWDLETRVAHLVFK